MEKEKIAFVLSAGGARGAIEAGVLLALLEAGIQPDILIGSSVGAINGAAMAIKPDLDGARRLVQEWLIAEKHNIFPKNYLSMSWRLLTRKPSLYPNSNLRRAISTRLLKDVHHFRDLKIARLYVGAVRLDTGELKVFGLEPDEPLLDALMSTTAFVPLLPPWEYHDNQYIDGGFKSELLINVAVDSNASEIYAIDVGVRRNPQRHFHSMFGILEQVLAVESYDHFLRDMSGSKNVAKDRFHYIGVPGLEQVRLWDFRFGKEMIELGKQAASRYLKSRSDRYKAGIAPTGEQKE